MIKFIIRWAINAAALYAAAAIVPGIDFEGDWMGLVWLALIISLLNMLLRPLLKLLKKDGWEIDEPAADIASSFTRSSRAPSRFPGIQAMTSIPRH